MALLAASGVRIRLVVVTDGEGSHPDVDPELVASRRAAESARAREVLGISAAEVIRLRLPDTRVAGHEAELAARLAELSEGFDVCLAPWEEDGHPDHEAVGRAARREGRWVLSYPVWMWHWAVPADLRVPWRRAWQVPLPGGVALKKRSAIRTFTSQLTDRTDAGPVLPADIVAHFTRTAEVLID
jgi:LmbE family N-acetylglucosaminyl deacetylase